MKTKGTVLSVNGTMAKVKIFKQSACAGCVNCSQKSECHADFMLSDKTNSYVCDAQNIAHAKVGDTVELCSESRISLLLAVLIFIMPIIATVVSYLLIDLKYSEIIAFAVAAGVFFVTFILFACVANALSKKFSRVEICKIIEENGRVAE